jgi:glucosamine 6-phosphate synthetase-like amidotransferase/phosphosugar isomerase protein
METNQEGKAEKFFKEFGKKLDQFLAELKVAGSRAEADMQEKYEELKDAAERIKKEAENKERWKEVENSLKKAGVELENAFKSAFKKKENTGGG